MNKKYLSFAAIFAILCPFITSCSAPEDVEVLRVYNCEDYILEDDDETGELGLVKQFEQHMRDSYGRNVKVV